MQRSLSTSSVPVPSLGSWRQAASVCGFTIDPVLRELGINQHDPHAQLRVSPLNLFKAFTLCVERARGHHFPFALGENFVFEHYAEFDAFVIRTLHVMTSAPRYVLGVADQVPPRARWRSRR